MARADNQRQNSPTAQFWISGKHLVLHGQQIDALWERIDPDAPLTAKQETIEAVSHEVEP